MQHLIRQFDIIPQAVLDQKITVIGAGAIGSFTILSLAKMGFHNIEVWDADVVSIENMNSQFYRFSDIDRPKVVALRNLVKDFTNVEIKTRLELYESGLLDGIVIAAVDSMAVRKNIWENLVGKTTAVKAVIDPRMGAETALLYVNNPLDPKHNERYKKTLYSDDDAVQERCTEKATMYTATMLSGLVAKAVKDLCVKDKTFDAVEWSIKHDDFVCHKDTDGDMIEFIERQQQRIQRAQRDIMEGPPQHFNARSATAEELSREYEAEGVRLHNDRAQRTRVLNGRTYDLMSEGHYPTGEDIYIGLEGPYRPRANPSGVVTEVDHQIEPNGHTTQRVSFRDQYMTQHRILNSTHRYFNPGDTIQLNPDGTISHAVGGGSGGYSIGYAAGSSASTSYDIVLQANSPSVTTVSTPTNNWSAAPVSEELIQSMGSSINFLSDTDALTGFTAEELSTLDRDMNEPF